MTFYKVSLETVVQVSAMVVSAAATAGEAVEEARALQERSRLDWRLGPVLVGPIQGECEYWTTRQPDGMFVVSVAARIVVTAIQHVSADGLDKVRHEVDRRQEKALIPWAYRGIPMGDLRGVEFRRWENTKPDVATSASLTVAPNPAFPGQTVYFSSTVSGADTPAGLVQFEADGSSIVAGSLVPDDVVQGVARSTAASGLSAGSRSVTARYLGSPGFVPSVSSHVVLNVVKVGTSVSLTVPSPPVTTGTIVTVGVIVSHSNLDAPAPTGTVTVFDGAVALKSLQLSAGSGVFNLGTMSAGVHNISVLYDGDYTHAGSTSPVSIITVI